MNTLINKIKIAKDSSYNFFLVLSLLLHDLYWTTFFISLNNNISNEHFQKLAPFFFQLMGLSLEEFPLSLLSEFKILFISSCNIFFFALIFVNLIYYICFVIGKKFTVIYISFYTYASLILAFVLLLAGIYSGHYSRLVHLPFLVLFFILIKENRNRMQKTTQSLELKN